MDNTKSIARDSAAAEAKAFEVGFAYGYAGKDLPFPLPPTQEAFNNYVDAEVAAMRADFDPQEGW